MKLYRSKRSIWTGTQIDAKAAQGGTDYEQIEVPTDKPSLLEFLNTFEVREAPASPPPPLPQSEPAPEGFVCPDCGRQAHIAEHMKNADAAICARADIEMITDSDVLKRLIARAQEHLDKIYDPLDDLL